MKTATILVMLALVVPVLAESENVPPKLREAADKIVAFAKNETVLNAVREQNKAPQTMEEIMRIDQDWVHGKIPAEYVDAILSNPCAAKLKEMEKTMPASLESFVMDAQGSLVCATKRTSDYYQGDEAKWQDSFNGGKGALIFGKRQYDESTKSTLLHISAPILSNGKAIGVIAVGINLTKLAEE